jgi:hypothetical protein
MLNAKRVFHKNIRQAIELGVLYNHLISTVAIPEQFDDLLRSQIVNAVSAFDKLMHDLIRIGMVRMFENQRPSTSKYLSETVAIQHLPALALGTVPPPPFDSRKSSVKSSVGCRSRIRAILPMA